MAKWPFLPITNSTNSKRQMSRIDQQMQVGPSRCHMHSMAEQLSIWTSTELPVRRSHNKATTFLRYHFCSARPRHIPLYIRSRVNCELMRWPTRQNTSMGMERSLFNQTASLFSKSAECTSGLILRVTGSGEAGASGGSSLGKKMVHSIAVPANRKDGMGLCVQTNVNHELTPYTYQCTLQSTILPSLSS